MNDVDDGDKLIMIARRRIAASPQRLFRAWTTADEFVRWWGPVGVVCEGAQIDLRVGGAYSIDNRLPDGALVTIEGVFQAIEPPHRLAYSWAIRGGAGAPERVVVSFTPVGEGTEVVVRHERIATAVLRDQHARGWEGCLTGLESLATATDPA